MPWSSSQVRKVSLVALQGRLPIQMPYSLRWPGAGGSAAVGLAATSSVSPFSALAFFSFFSFFSFRLAFLEAGSGRLMSISSSSSGATMGRLRFFSVSSGLALAERWLSLSDMFGICLWWWLWCRWRP